MVNLSIIINISVTDCCIYHISLLGTIGIRIKKDTKAKKILELD